MSTISMSEQLYMCPQCSNFPLPSSSDLIVYLLGPETQLVNKLISYRQPNQQQTTHAVLVEGFVSAGDAALKIFALGQLKDAVGVSCSCFNYILTNNFTSVLIFSLTLGALSSKALQLVCKKLIF